LLAVERCPAFGTEFFVLFYFVAAGAKSFFFLSGMHNAAAPRTKLVPPECFLPAVCANPVVVETEINIFLKGHDPQNAKKKK
jgi:hypothetical protein